MDRYTAYDPFAWIYNRHWSHFPADIMPILDRLVLSHLAPGAHVLDLCCGTGQLARMLNDRGYRVTGVDGSAQMLAFAGENAPEAELIVADARDFRLASAVDAVFSTYDSLNHVMNVEELAVVFRNVHAALRGGGRFLFDLNMAEKYEHRWTDSTGIVEDDHVCVVRGNYETESGIARFDATIFVRGDAPAGAALSSDGWDRSDVTILQRCYSEAEVREALSSAGFGVIRGLEGRRDLGADGQAGRMFFLCQKPGTNH